MWSLIQGDKFDEERDDPQSKGRSLIEVEDEDLVDAWGGDDDLDDALEVGGGCWDEGGFWRRGFLCGSEEKEKGNVMESLYMICDLWRRCNWDGREGVLCKWGSMRCHLTNHGRPSGGVRWRLGEDILRWKSVEENGFWKRLGIWEIGNLFGLWRKERKIEKRKMVEKW